MDCGSEYVFVIKDSNGDGICCGIFGNGSYSLAQGSTIIAEGDSFGSVDSTFFRVDFCYTNGTPFSDNCAVTSTDVSPSSLSICDLGSQTFELSVSDSSGNETTCQVQVEVVDTSGALITCTDTTVYLDAAGAIAIDSSTILMTNALDGCSATSTLSASSFGCNDVGSQAVTLTLTTSGGASASCSANVTVVDSTGPDLVCSDTAVVIDSVSTLVVDESYFQATYSDACGIDTVVLSQTDFTCFDAGANIITITVTDENGNQATCTPTLTVEADTFTIVLAASVQACGNNISCNGASDGTITTTVTGGCFPYSYLWNTGATAANLSNLTAGTYVLTLTDSLGATLVDSIVLSEPGPISPALVASSFVCDGDSTGTIDLTVTGGNDCSAYTYAWSNGATTEDLSGIPAGTYAVVVADTMGCTGSDSIVLAAVSALAVDLGADTAICTGESLVLDAGAGYADYLWSNGDSAQSIFVGMAGTYSVAVTDTNGCGSTDSLVLALNALPQPSLGPDTTICSSDSISLSPGSFSSFQWSTGATSSSITANAGGVFAVTVTDANSCSNTDSIVVTQANAVQVDIVAQGDTNLCPEDSVLLVATSGLAGYVWSNGATTDSIWVAGQMGTFSVEVTDSLGCVGSDTALTTLYVPDMVELGNDTAICDGEAVVLDAGASFTTFNWSTGDSTQSISIDQAGTYTISVQDSNGCASSDSLTLFVNALPNPDLGADTTICQGASLLLSPGNFDAYQWSTGSTGPVIQTMGAGTYAVTVSDANGCENSDAITVSESGTVSVFILNSGSSPICQGDTVVLSVVGNYASYLWNTGDTTASIEITGQGGTYTVTVANADGCTGSASEAVTYLNVPNPTPAISPSPAVDLCDGETVTLYAGGGYSSYQWSDGSSSQTRPCKNAHSN